MAGWTVRIRTPYGGPGAAPRIPSRHLRFRPVPPSEAEPSPAPVPTFLNPPSHPRQLSAVNHQPISSAIYSIVGALLFSPWLLRLRPSPSGPARDGALRETLAQDTGAYHVPAQRLSHG